jgi:hypothetical protein
VCRSPLPGVGRENPPTWWYEFKGPPRGQIDGNRAGRRYPRDPVITTADVLLKVRRLFYYVLLELLASMIIYTMTCSMRIRVLPILPLTPTVLVLVNMWTYPRHMR